MTSKNPFYGATFAERKAAREGVETPAPESDDTKAVDPASTEDKSITSAQTKRTNRRKP